MSTAFFSCSCKFRKSSCYFFLQYNRQGTRPYSYRLEPSPLCSTHESCLRLRFTTHSTPFWGYGCCWALGVATPTHNLRSFEVHFEGVWRMEIGEGEGRGRHWANDYSKVVNLNGNCDETKSKKILHKTKKKKQNKMLKLHKNCTACERDSCSWSG